MVVVVVVVAVAAVVGAVAVAAVVGAVGAVVVAAEVMVRPTWSISTEVDRYLIGVNVLFFDSVHPSRFNLFFRR